MKVLNLVFRYFSECRKGTKKLEGDSREATGVRKVTQVKNHDVDVAFGTKEVANPTYLTLSNPDAWVLVPGAATV